MPDFVQDIKDTESFAHGDPTFLCSERELLITLLEMNIK